jgi:O-antigen/teichoic acid export membrane protein
MVFFQKIKDIGKIGIGDTIGSGLGAIFWFYLAAEIGPEQYGEIQWFIGIASAMSYIALFGTQNTIIIFAAKKVKIQSTLYFISLLSSLVLSTIAIIIFPSFYKIDVGVIIFAYVINTLAIGDLLGKKLYSEYSKYIILQKALTISLGILFLHLFGYESIIFALAISYVFYLKRIIESFRKMEIKFSMIKPRFNFIINNYIFILISGFHGQIDKLLVAPILGFTILGNFSLGMQFITVLAMFSGVIFKYLLSQDSSNVENNRLKIFSVICSIGITILGIIFLPITIPIFFPEFTSIIDAIQIMCLHLIPLSISLIFESKLLARLKTRYVVIGRFAGLGVMIVGMIILGSLYGIIGVAITFVLGTTTFCIIYMIGAIRLPEEEN